MHKPLIFNSDNFNSNYYFCWLLLNLFKIHYIFHGQNKIHLWGSRWKLPIRFLWYFEWRILLENFCSNYCTASVPWSHLRQKLTTYTLWTFASWSLISHSTPQSSIPIQNFYQGSLCSVKPGSWLILDHLYHIH